MVAAFLLFGLRKAGTPLEIASTPVSAAQPDEKARASRKISANVVIESPYPGAGSMSSVALSDVRQVAGGAARRGRRRTCPRIATMKAYVGIAKNVPDSRMPRRFIAASRITRRVGDRRLVPVEPGIAPAAYCAPDEIDTATVST